MAEVRSVQIFIHDSLHTTGNTLFEVDQVTRAMVPGGVMLVDDISTHRGFITFARRHPEYQTVVCPSADRLGEFGIPPPRTKRNRRRADSLTPQVSPQPTAPAARPAKVHFSGQSDCCHSEHGRA